MVCLFSFDQALGHGSLVMRAVMQCAEIVVWKIVFHCFFVFTSFTVQRSQSWSHFPSLRSPYDCKIEQVQNIWCWESGKTPNAWRDCRDGLVFISWFHHTQCYRSVMFQCDLMASIAVEPAMVRSCIPWVKEHFQDIGVTQQYRLGWSQQSLMLGRPTLCPWRVDPSG